MSGRTTAVIAAMLALVGMSACSPTGAKHSASASPTTSARPSFTPIPVPTGGCAVAAGMPHGMLDHGTMGAPPKGAAIAAQDFLFAPTCLTAVPRGRYQLTVFNQSKATTHNFTIDGVSSEDIEPGRLVTVNLTVGAANIHFYCKYHKDKGMVGVIIPGEATAAVSSPSGPPTAPPTPFPSPNLSSLPRRTT